MEKQSYLEQKNFSKKSQLSKFISFILRHKPEAIGITLDKNGWAEVEKLIKGINQSGKQMDRELLEEIVAEDKKGRYSFDETGKKIRANQGHSIFVDVELKKMKPPKFLYHGTASRFLESIQKEGIKSGSRLYVHLSKDVDTAMNVGKRHGKPVVLKVHAQEMEKNGCDFYLSENGVWLTKEILKKYFEVEN